MPSKKYPVIDAQSAIKKHNENIQGFKEIERRMNKANVDKILPENEEPTLDDFLAENGLPQTFSVKMALAKKVGMGSYSGRPDEDKRIMRALTAMMAKSGEQDTKESESKNRDREFGLKEKELSLKEKEIESKKMPGADEIAQSLMSKFKQQ